MLNITFAPRDATLAETIQADLGAAHLSLEKNYLLVLFSAATAQDTSVTDAVHKAIADKHTVMPVLLDDVALPPLLAGLPIIDMRNGYKTARLIGMLKREDMGTQRRRANWFVLTALLVIVVIMFVAAVLGIAGGVVGFPEEEYATQAAQTDKMLAETLFPTLDGLMPRSTQEANNFAATVTVAPTRLRPFIIQTATAQSGAIQQTIAAQTTPLAATATPQP